MVISATDFQLRVNEYFNKLIQGEDVIIERYNSKFAVLVSYEKYLEKFKNEETSSKKKNETKKIEKEQEVEQKIEQEVEQKNTTPQNPTQLTQEELMKLLKLLLKE